MQILNVVAIITAILEYIPLTSDPSNVQEFEK